MDDKDKTNKKIDQVVSFKFICFLLVTFVLALIIFSTCHLKSLRNSVSDSITISSIILAILGILLSIFMSFDHNTEFVKRAKKYKVDKNIFTTLFKRIIYNFYLNITVILFTMIYDILPSSENKILKNFINSFWAMLFLGSVVAVILIVRTISKIYLFNFKDNTKMET